MENLRDRLLELFRDGHIGAFGFLALRMLLMHQRGARKEQNHEESERAAAWAPVGIDFIRNHSDLVRPERTGVYSILLWEKRGSCNVVGLLPALPFFFPSGLSAARAPLFAVLVPKPG